MLLVFCAFTAAEQGRLSRMMGQWDNQIQGAIEDLYELSPEERQALI